MLFYSTYQAVNQYFNYIIIYMCLNYKQMLKVKHCFSQLIVFK